MLHWERIMFQLLKQPETSLWIHAFTGALILPDLTYTNKSQQPQSIPMVNHNQ
jgi:hypothetical protein